MHDPFMNYLTFFVEAKRAFSVLISCFLFHTDLAIENLALRQQVAVLKVKKPRPKLSGFDRMFWVGEIGHPRHPLRRHGQHRRHGERSLSNFRIGQYHRFQPVFRSDFGKR